MNNSLLEKRLEKYKPANTLDHIMSLKWRERIKDFFIDFTIVLFVWFFVSSQLRIACMAVANSLYSGRALCFSMSDSPLAVTVACRNDC